MERGFKVHSINPKQMDRFRDRFTLAGAKDDSRDAEVMAQRCAPIRVASGCLLSPTRSSSNGASDLSAERNRLTNRMREQLWCYFPALLELESDLGAGVVARSLGDRAYTGQSGAHPRADDRQASQAPSHPPVRRRPCARDVASAAAQSRGRIDRIGQRPRHYAHCSHPPRQPAAQTSTSSARLPEPPASAQLRSGSRRRQSSMTWRSSHPCRGREGSSSPRCSQKRSMPCSGVTTPPCAL